jgi:glycosyltransferase involved in cell wall biosynthesis
MYKISIIITVYNVEKYLNKCLDSVICQTFKDIEVLCIDDGSTDNSLNILREYEKKDGRIKVFTQKNSGLSTVRNIGLQNAKGEYVWFINAGDLIEANAMQIIYEKAKINNADMVIFAACSYDDKKKTFAETDHFDKDDKYILLLNMVPSEYSNRIFTFEDARQWLLDVPLELWNRLYKREFLAKHNIKLHIDLQMSNDGFFNIECYLNGAKILILKEIVCNYCLSIEIPVVSKLTTADCKYYDYSLKLAKKTNILIKQKYRKMDLAKYLIIRDIDRICAHYKLLKGLNKIKFHIKANIFLNKEKGLYTQEIFNSTAHSKLINKIKNTGAIKYLLCTILNKIATTNKADSKTTIKFLGIEVIKQKIDNRYKRWYLFGIRLYKKKRIDIFERFTAKTPEEEIMKLKNLYLDKGRLFIIGNAPSINNMNISLLNNEYTLVVNRGYMLKDKGLKHASFYCICDMYSYRIYGNEIDLSFADYYFASTWTGWDRPCDNLYTFDISLNWDITGYEKMQFDISKPIITGRTVVLEALQIAIYMGFKEIYFIGVDLNFTAAERHFYRPNEEENKPEYTRWANENTMSMINNFKSANSILSKNGIKIYNAGIGGNLNTIERVDYSSLFNEGKK